MAKNNDRLNRLLKIALWLVPILAGLAIACGVYRERISNMSNRINEVAIKAEANKTAVTEIKTDIKYIKEAVDRIENKME